MNIGVWLSYDGTRYDGWQKQGNTDRTIQGKLEAVLEKLEAGGRTAVHAEGQVEFPFGEEHGSGPRFRTDRRGSSRRRPGG